MQGAQSRGKRRCDLCSWLSCTCCGVCSTGRKEQDLDSYMSTDELLKQTDYCYVPNAAISNSDFDSIPSPPAHTDEAPGALARVLLCSPLLLLPIGSLLRIPWLQR